MNPFLLPSATGLRSCPNPCGAFERLNFWCDGDPCRHTGGTGTFACACEKNPAAVIGLAIGLAFAAILIVALCCCRYQMSRRRLLQEQQQQHMQSGGAHVTVVAGYTYAAFPPHQPNEHSALVPPQYHHNPAHYHNDPPHQQYPQQHHHYHQHQASPHHAAGSNGGYSGGYDTSSYTHPLVVAEGIPLGGAPPSVVAANVAVSGGGVPHPSHGASVAQSPGAELLHPAVAAAGGEGGAYFYSPQSSATNRSDNEKAAGALH